MQYNIFKMNMQQKPWKNDKKRCMKAKSLSILLVFKK